MENDLKSYQQIANDLLKSGKSVDDIRVELYNQGFNIEKIEKIITVIKHINKMNKKVNIKYLSWGIILAVIGILIIFPYIFYMMPINYILSTIIMFSGITLTLVGIILTLFGFVKLIAPST